MDLDLVILGNMETSARRALGIVGCGVMAEAMVAGLVSQGILPAHAIVASHPRESRRRELEDRYGIAAVVANADAAADADVVLLGVKPQVLGAVARDLAGKLAPDQIVLSIVAGASRAALARLLGHERVVRSMPNTPAQIGQGVTVWCPAAPVTEEEKQTVRRLLSALGHAVEVADERQVAMATALSGTGPTYVFSLLEALVDAGVHMGFPRHVARELVLLTLSGAASFAVSSGKHPAELRDMVTSPGGTSAEALYQLESGRFKTVLADAVWSAFGRTLELEAVLEGVPREGFPRGTPGRP